MNAALDALGWDPGRSAEFSRHADTHLPGRVARVDRGAVDVLTGAGGDTVRERASLAAHVHDVVSGDWVAVAAAPDGHVVEDVLPRRTQIRRAVASGRSEAQVLAANVDVVLVCVAAVPEPRPGMIERLVALSWDSGATPVVVLTKCDLQPESAAVAADLADAAPGVDVVTADAVTPGGADAVRDRLGAGRTAALLGRSGAGKSTLVNVLVGAAVAVTGDVRRDGKGRHTTTHRDLLPLPGGGVLLDTPGLRGAGLWVGAEGLERAFGDLDSLAQACRFTDCAHVTEPGCAVLEAVDDGRLTERRLASWRKLQRESRWIASRTDARLRAEQRRAWKVVTQEARRGGRTRP